MIGGKNILREAEDGVQFINIMLTHAMQHHMCEPWFWSISCPAREKAAKLNLTQVISQMMGGMSIVKEKSELCEKG